MSIFKKFIALLLPIVISYWLFIGSKFNPEEILGKRVLVTGASSGIGEQVAYKYAELGAKLVITARRKELLKEVEKNCRKLGAQSVHAVPADMAKPADRKAVVEATKKHLGGLDILILNHALFHMDWLTWSPEDVSITESVMNVNFHSFHDITNQLLIELKESKGYIGIVSSISGKAGSVRLAAFSASNHALQGFFSSLRQELRTRNVGISVTLVVYGPVKSKHAIERSNLPSEKALKEIFKYGGSTQDAADALVKGVAARDYEIHFPTVATFFCYLNRMIPNCLEDATTSIMQ